MLEQAITWLAIGSAAVPLLLWGYVAQNRERLPTSSIPDRFGIKVGLIVYIWSDTHERAKDRWLSRLVSASRIAFALQCLAIVLCVFFIQP